MASTGLLRPLLFICASCVAVLFIPCRPGDRRYLACLICAFWVAALFMPRAGGGPAAIQPLSAYDDQVRELMAQMTQPDQQFVEDVSDIQKYHVGSLLSGGDSDPKSGNTLRDWTDMVDRYQSEALKTRLHIPLLYGVDALHGHNNVLGAVIFPHNIGMGCAHNRDSVEKAARITAEEVRATGINWAFAPCVTVPQDIRWGRTYEGFGETPQMPALLGGAAIRGLQGRDLADPLAVLACAKHYAGDGGTTWGTGLHKMLDHGDTRVDEATLRKSTCRDTSPPFEPA